MPGTRNTDYFKMFNDCNSQCVTNTNRNLKRSLHDHKQLHNDYFSSCKYHDENITTGLSLDHFLPDIKHTKPLYKSKICSKSIYDGSPLVMERKQNTINIRNDQLPSLLDNIINLKSHIKEIKTNEKSAPNSNTSLNSSQPKVPNFNYPSEQSNKPYIEHCETGNYYNTNEDYLQNNSDFFRGSSDVHIGKRISDYSFSITPSIGTPELPLRIEYSHRRNLVHYLKARLKHGYNDDSNHSIASIGSKSRRMCRRHRGHLRNYTRHFKRRFKQTISRRRWNH
ncbi:hypothetical protein C6P45_001291 [Maudiozyma exigua]|uniref:Uncharacterized protein n=1 Tax=Maudiozyma exigua TaxID=34358 RepID=A0A9P7B5V7_MAUEX|nr:hypothetical protein C6P45_001291 [Kazachstania exigua]